MGNLKEHVTGIELSRRLKELGLKQESCFYWARSYNQSDDKCVLFFNHIGTLPKYRISAFLLSELIEICIEQGWYHGNIVSHNNLFMYTLRKQYDGTWITYRIGTLGQLIVYGLENKILSLK